MNHSSGHRISFEWVLSCNSTLPLAEDQDRFYGSEVWENVLLREEMGSFPSSLGGLSDAPAERERQLKERGDEPC
jgi:hypothetical protein